MPNPHPVVTRIAPSPTGYLHIGTARTALFNYLYARHHGGVFHLRIEDTDRARSTEDATQSILRSLEWLGMKWDGEIVHQFARSPRHAEIAHAMVAEGHAYFCFTPPAELEALRNAAQAEGKVFKFQSPWRDRDPSEAPEGAKPVIRLKAPREGSVTLTDGVQGEITVPCTELDDMVLLRSDGTPTYMLAVVVDDHDMGITHVIRGNDHLSNTFRQYLIYKAMGWEIPQFAHIPLIHGMDGAKLSKRHGALGVEAYKEMGYLPEALRNYLLRLGWAHGDDEIISDQQAIEWFNLDGCGKSPSRFDFAKLENLNAHYIRESDDHRLLDLILPFLGEVDGFAKKRILRGMPGLKSRAKTLKELAENAKIYISRLDPDEKAQSLLEKGRAVILTLIPAFQEQEEWTKESLENLARVQAESLGEKLGNVAQPLRAALTGRSISPSVFEVMEILGKEESIRRLEKT